MAGGVADPQVVVDRRVAVVFHVAGVNAVKHQRALGIAPELQVPCLDDADMHGGGGVGIDAEPTVALHEIGGETAAALDVDGGYFVVFLLVN